MLDMLTEIIPTENGVGLPLVEVWLKVIVVQYAFSEV